ncbi:MAG TPA: hypothetical protein VEH27_17480 [Methylomirabilota bacterium]|nr:hypothetical protein [Methylomirabilota bacterium]
MNKQLLRAFGLLTLAVALAGCHSTVDGRMRAGMPIVKDQLESRYERPTAQAFQAAKDVLAFNGTLVSENTIANVVEARVDTRTVWVRVEEVEPKVCRVLVQARKKNRTPDIDLASEISKQIALKLAATR